MHKILVVEDDVSLAHTLESTIRKIPALVEVAYTIFQAKKLIEENGDFDLVLLDRNLPDGDGMELLALLEAECFTTRVMVLTTQARQEEVEEGLEWGADQYMAKPFSYHELTLRIRNELAKQKLLVADIYRLHDLTFDIYRNLLIYENNEVLLCNKEAELLKFFFERSDRVIPKEEVVEMVWGRNNNGHLLATYVQRLRKKLGPYKEALETLPHVGYRLLSQSNSR